MELDPLFESGQMLTPAMVVDASVVRANIQRVARYCDEHQLGLRPHTKTHKSRKIGRLQIEAGASGLAMAKVGEVSQFADAFDDLLLAYPPVDFARAQQVAAMNRDRIVRSAIDSSYAIELAATAAKSEQVTIGLLVDLDVGLHRTGTQSPQHALELAIKIDRTEGVRLDGLMVYPGQIWNLPNEQAPALQSVADLMAETLDLWHRSGLDAKIVSGGSTPTLYQSHLVPQLTEIRPGTYVYNDMNTVRGGFCQLEDCAATIVTTVISNSVPDQVVVDAGSKTLTSDRCIPAPESGHGYIVEYPQAKIVALSEEHGQVDVSKCDVKPKLGERISVIPNHVCPCVNLRDEVWWLEPSSTPQPMKIDTRGKIV